MKHARSHCADLVLGQTKPPKHETSTQSALAPLLAYTLSVRTHARAQHYTNHAHTRKLRTLAHRIHNPQIGIRACACTRSSPVLVHTYKHLIPFICLYARYLYGLYIYKHMYIYVYVTYQHKHTYLLRVYACYIYMYTPTRTHKHRQTPTHTQAWMHGCMQTKRYKRTRLECKLK